MAERGHLDAATVLVLDGVRMHRRALRALLIDEGYVVFEADSLVGALHALRLVRPQVALVQARLPSGDGFQATRHLTAADPDLKVVLSIGAASVEGTNAALRAGAFAAVVKGDPPDALLHLVLIAAERHRAAAAVATADGLQLAHASEG